MTLAQFAVKNALRNPRRSLLTVLSVGVSLLLLTFLISLWRGFFQVPQAPAAVLRILSRHRVGLTAMLPSYYRDKMAALPGVVAVTSMDWVGGRYLNDNPENQFGQLAADPDTVFTVYTDWTVDPEQLRAWQRDRTGVAVQRLLAERMGWKLGDRIYLQAKTWPADFDLRVRAIFDAPSEWQVLLLSDQYFTESVPAMKDRVGIVALRVASEPQVAQVSQAIDAMFRNAPAPTLSQSEKAFQLYFMAMMGNVKEFIVGIAAAVVFTILLVTGNTMAMAVRERTREVALLKTLGFTRRAILGLFLGEGITLALLGGVLGTLGARLLLLGLSASSWGFYFHHMRVTGVEIGWGLAVAALVGAASTALPSARAARLDIIAGLRHMG
ncbi:MAG TPA: FtsX-like permease family protein [Terriglobales bacterium]|nr:FtsX-like permease family protein [Terriglobales bacterium]